MKPESTGVQTPEQLRKALDEAREECRQMAEELDRAYEDLHLFAQIASQIHSCRVSRQMLLDLLQGTCEAVRADLAAVCFPKQPEASAEVMRPDAASLIPDPTAFAASLAATMPESAPEFDPGCFILNDADEVPRFAAMHDRPFRALSVSIANEGRQFGWLLLVSFNMKEIFRRGEYRLLGTMAGQLAVVMANTELYADLEQFVINLVKSLIITIEAKDVYTKGHSDRVSRLSMRLGMALGLDAERYNHLQWASLLHDLGKIGTPEALLNKDGRLSDAEFDTIRAHPAKGGEILAPITQLAKAIPAIRHHHERYDGSGYPDGLQGEAIPLLARIISVADTYDAITSDRAYRKARTHEEAMQIIESIAGTQLDPQVVKVFSQSIATNGPWLDSPVPPMSVTETTRLSS